MLAFRDAGPSVLPGGDQTATASILEELLIALMGHTGDIFVDVSSSGRGKIADPGACSFATAKDLRFISAPDRCTLPDDHEFFLTGAPSPIAAPFWGGYLETSSTSSMKAEHALQTLH